MATYEAEAALSARSFLSYRRAISLSHMLELQNLDSPSDVAEQSYVILEPARDQIEVEERRRTFWYLYFCDKWAASSPGRSSNLKEQDVWSFSM